ncbi:hypothetical protein AB1Y20_011511 [Prymnesium parvum]|uniref:Potassium channel domain-containing protein n=1 Tax=Prymnesium parvum TaxID=97485 RepID=A0AB34IK79_PRYPA
MWGRAPPPPPSPPSPLLSPSAMLLSGLAAAFLLLVLSTPPSPSSVLSPRRVYSLSAVLLTASSLLLTAAEPHLSAVDAFYLSCMTFSTIGYGDIDHPSTPLGRLLVMVLAIGGVAFFGLTIELLHSLREKTDGALLRLVGVRGAAAAALMLAVNAAAGVGLCFSLTEDAQMPKDVLGALYWSVITGTSVGYGDFHPTSDVGKLCVCVYAFCTMQATANAMGVFKSALVQLCTPSPGRRPQSQKTD